MKENFITAYMWMFGSTRKEASQAYKAAETSYINEIIKGFKGNTKQNFYND